MAKQKHLQNPAASAPTAEAEAIAANPVPDAPVPQAEPTESVRHFFKPEDWITSLVTTLISGFVFFYYMAPEVTLQDSGELVTGAFNFGVPHPPGYPFWALMGYVWSHFIVPFGNPAWRMALLSVVTGALTVGVLTIMMTRSIRLLLHSLPWGDRSHERETAWIAATVGASAALLFGFNRGVWLWAVVSEMRVLNVFSFMLTACLFFTWAVQPQQRKFLYMMIGFFGLSLGNHQTISVMVVPLAVGVLAVGLNQFFERRRLGQGTDSLPRDLMTSLSDFWELATAGAFCAMVGMWVFAWLESGWEPALTSNPKFWLGLVAGVAGIVGLVAGLNTQWWQPRRALACAGVFLAAISIYFYMPIAAWTNPPMNWGYAGTRAGFLHAITRGQYEQVKAFEIFREEFFTKIKVFVEAMMHQYSLPVTLLGLILVGAAVWVAVNRRDLHKRLFWTMVASVAGGLVLFTIFFVVKDPNGQPWMILVWALGLGVVMTFWMTLWHAMMPRGRAWMVFVTAAFLITSLGLLSIINPKLDRQEQEINIKFFAPAHGFYAMLIGYGIALVASYVAARRTALTSILVRVACVGCLALPIVSFRQNMELCNLRGHDFGYLFGYLMFYPGGGYEPMERDAVLYGGTDPGRFVPTYMIFCESRVAPKDRFTEAKLPVPPNAGSQPRDFDRSDVYIITQNALADNTYMSYIRDHYDFSRPTNVLFQSILKRDRTYPPQPIHIPSPEESNKAFQEYVQGVQSGRIPASADIKIENGRVSVQGVGGVMEINGILARWIFEKNKDKHAFYVEESYVIPWMYSYLRPSGIIMKIEKDPVPSPQEDPGLWAGIVAKDKAYWDKVTTEFTNREEFVRNSDAKKSFSKLRSAIAGLYAARGMASEAEYAFRQAIALCPESPEASFRLADLFVRLRRYGEARKLMEDYHNIDIYNRGALDFLNRIMAAEQDDKRRVDLEKSMGEGKLDVGRALDLANVYARLGMEAQFQSLTRSLVENTNLPPDICLRVAQIYGSGRRWDMIEYALGRYLQRDDRNFRVWIELAVAQLAQNKQDQAFASLRRAVNAGDEAARTVLRNDQRFAPLRATPFFQSLVPPGRQASPFGLPLDNGPQGGFPIE